MGESTRAQFCALAENLPITEWWNETVSLVMSVIKEMKSEGSLQTPL